jgi:hypothetical protein
MLPNWKSHCYHAPVQFEQIGRTLTIINDAPDSQGSWIAWHNHPIHPGRRFQLLGSHDGGHIKIRFFRIQTDYLHGCTLEPGETFTVPPGAALLRVDCRLWGEQGRATFQNIHLVDLPPQKNLSPRPFILEHRNYHLRNIYSSTGHRHPTSHIRNPQSQIRNGVPHEPRHHI